MISNRTSAKMCVDTHVSGGTTQALSLSIWNMLLCLRITILFRHTKIHYVNN
jgi:hypothetical protein